MNTDGLSSGQKGSFTKQLNKFKQEARIDLTEIKGIKNTVKALNNEFFVDEEERASLKTQAHKAIKEIDEYNDSAKLKHDEIDSYFDNLLVSDDPEEGEEAELCIKDIIDVAAEEVAKHSRQTLLLRENLRKADRSVNGYNEAANEELGTEEKYIPGLIDDLQKSINEADEFHELQDQTTDKLYKKINNLLAGATTASLATAYENQMRSYAEPNSMWSFIFMVSMFVMIWFGYHTIPIVNDFDDAIKSIIARAPIFGGLIWLGIFASKQQSQNKRLEQEYAHKASLARSFEGYKKQVKDLNDDVASQETLNKLINNVIDAIEHNPSETLDKNYHTSDNPINTAFNSTRGN